MLLILNFKQEALNTFNLTRLRIEPGSTVSVADALSTRPSLPSQVTSSSLAMEVSIWS